MTLANNLPIMRCPLCRGTMRLVRMVPMAGQPDLLVVGCVSCNEVEVKEDRRAA
jgi:hypothetical protein